MLLNESRFPTLSDLMDPVLAHPIVRDRDDRVAAMRSMAGRSAVDPAAGVGARCPGRGAVVSATSAISAGGFVLLGLIGLALEWAGRPRPTETSGPAPAGAAPSAAMRITNGRVAVLMWWLWLGVHFLAR